MNSNHILCKTNNVEVHIEAGSQVPSFRLPCVVLIFYMFALFVTQTYVRLMLENWRKEVHRMIFGSDPSKPAADVIET